MIESTAGTAGNLYDDIWYVFAWDKNQAFTVHKYVIYLFTVVHQLHTLYVRRCHAETLQAAC